MSSEEKATDYRLQAAEKPVDVEAKGADDSAPEDDSPQEGDILEPGDHLIEVVTQVPCRREILTTGLRRVGFTHVLHDQSRVRSGAVFAVREHRFVGRLAQAITLHQRDVLQWHYVRRLAAAADKGASATTDVNDYRLTVEPFDLVPGTTYETLFMSKMKTQPNRAAVEDHLNEMGFGVEKLTMIQRDVRLRERPNASLNVWFGLLTWEADVSTFLTDADPFYFETMRSV